MNSTPLVSVGLPTYNRASTLRRAVESIVGQDYRNLELIIGDNASTDDTERVCAQYCAKDSRVRYIRHASNLGANANFRHVLSEARGEYFMSLGDDDWLDPGYISQCLEVLESCRDYSLACGAAKYFEEDVFAYERERINLSEESGKERVLSYFRQVIANGMFYGVMRREQFIQIPARIILAGDWLMMASVAFMGKVRTLDTVFVNRALGGSSEDLEQLALNLGHSRFQSRHHFVTIATIVFKDIAWKSPVYAPLGERGRLLLAMKAFKIVAARLCWPQWGIRTRLKQMAQLTKKMPAGTHDN